MLHSIPPPISAAGEQRRRGDRERLADHPRRGAGRVDHGAADQGDRHIEREAELAPAQLSNSARGGRDQRQADQQRARDRRRGQTEVADGPDAGELEPLSGLDQVAELGVRGLAAREQRGERGAAAC